MELNGSVSIVIKYAKLHMEESKENKHSKTIFRIWTQAWKEDLKFDLWSLIHDYLHKMKFINIEHD